LRFRKDINGLRVIAVIGEVISVGLTRVAANVDDSDFLLGSTRVMSDEIDE